MQVVKLGEKDMKTIELNNGFKAEVAVDYYKMTYNGQTIYQDSSCEDCYDEESAEYFFNNLLDEYSFRLQEIVKIAIDKGFKDIVVNDFETTYIEAENYIITTTEECDKKAEIVWDFWSNPNYLYFSDENNEVCVDASGEIVSNDYKLRSYARIKDGHVVEKVKYFYSDEDDVFCYLDTIVTSNGEVVDLYA